MIAIPALNRHGWRGGWSPAARFLVPVMPFLVATAFEYVARAARLPAAVKALIGAQVAIDLLLWRRPKLLWNAGDGASELAAALSPPGLDLVRWLPSAERPMTAPFAASLAFLACWLLASFRAETKKAGAPRDARP